MENDCSNKIEANILIKVKFDPDNKTWYVKSFNMAHDDQSF